MVDTSSVVSRATPAGGVRVGMFPAGLNTGGDDPQRLHPMLATIDRAGVDHLCVGDHVSFFVGAGSDGLLTATALLAAQQQLPVYVGLYLLPLRHPVLVARQLATIAQLAPGRLTLGVGIGGEDPHEIEICGVDPKTRGRRMDECLRILRALGDGTPTSFTGEFFTFDNALIAPAPTPPIALVVGGRSEAAVTRAARLGDGWLGIWVSPRRYADVCEQINRQAAAAGRDTNRFEHALNVWCGFGATPESARQELASKMQNFYQMPFDPFERYSPYGTPQDVAEFLSPYVDAGCSAFNLIPCANDDESAIAAVGEVRALLDPSVTDVKAPRIARSQVAAAAAPLMQCGQ